MKRFFLEDSLLTTLLKEGEFKTNTLVTPNNWTYYSILGLYLIYFMMILGLIRSCRADVNEIWIHDLPNADILLRVCFYQVFLLKFQLKY